MICVLTFDKAGSELYQHHIDVGGSCTEEDWIIILQEDGQGTFQDDILIFQYQF